MALARVLFTVLCGIQFAVFVYANGNCSRMNFIPADCCKFPEITGPEFDKFKRAVLKVNGNQLIEDYLDDCKLTAGLFNEYKFTKGIEIEVDDIEKLVDKALATDEWKSVMKAVAKECKTKVNVKYTELIKKMEAEPFNVKTDQCDLKPNSFTVCFLVESFKNCPQSQWTDVEECEASKHWVAECGDDIDSIKELGQKL